MATLSPMITPLPGAKLYKLTPMHFEFLSVRQNVLKEKGFDKAPLSHGQKFYIYIDLILASF